MFINFNLILIIIVVFVLSNGIFKQNKTSFILLSGLLVFLLSFCYIIFLGFEFLALSFIITYMGGIIVMFLFLVMVIEVSSENTKELKSSWSLNYIYMVIFGIFCVIFISEVLLFNYDFYSYNNIGFYRFINDNFYCGDGFANYEGLVYTDLKVWNWVNYSRDYFLYVANTAWSTQIFSEFSYLNNNFGDIYALGLFLYSKYSFLLMLIMSLLLLISVILSTSICSLGNNFFLSENSKNNLDDFILTESNDVEAHNIVKL